MVTCMCVVQGEQAPDRRQEEMKTLLQGFSDRAFGEAAQIAWLPVPPGNGFTAGKPSSSSVVAFTANQPLGAEQRETLLRELASLWTEETGCSLDEIVAVISDPT